MFFVKNSMKSWYFNANQEQILCKLMFYTNISNFMQIGLLVDELLPFKEIQDYRHNYSFCNWLLSRITRLILVDFMAEKPIFLTLVNLNCKITWIMWWRNKYSLFFSSVLFVRVENKKSISIKIQRSISDCILDLLGPH